MSHLYKVTISTKAADFNFDRSPDLISIGRCEEDFPYTTHEDAITIYDATDECVNALLALGIQMQIEVTSRTGQKTSNLDQRANYLEAEIKALRTENSRLRDFIADKLRASQSASQISTATLCNHHADANSPDGTASTNDPITLSEARENARSYAQNQALCKAHDQLKRIYEITME